MDEKPQPPAFISDERPGSALLGSQGLARPGQGPLPSVFVLNPFAEAYIARGKAYTPVKHQAMLAEDLANLPQFLCEPGDIVLLAKRPSGEFLTSLEQAGFASPEFVELGEWRIHPANELCRRRFGSLRPWAWGPDSVELLDPLFARVATGAQSAKQYFNSDVGHLYSKAWSAVFLREVLSRCYGGEGTPPPRARGKGAGGPGAWLCTEQEAGVTVDTLEAALGAVAAIRGRGHHRVVVKEAQGLAGHNAIRLWEPQVLPAQRQWMARVLGGGQQLVIEPWLERELDFSVQLEMGPGGLKLCGYTGLVNDRKGQYLANWAEADYDRCPPARVAALFPEQAEILESIQGLYGEISRLLGAELNRVGFVGPVSIDAFVYRTPQGACRLKPVVEINPRYTMGRLTLELMKHTSPGSCGLLRLVSLAQARAEGFTSLAGYARSLRERVGLCLEGEPNSTIRQGAICLNDPGQARACLATFAVGPTLNLASSLSGNERRGSQ